MRLTDHVITFSGAGTREFQSVGRYLRIRDASSPVYLSFDGASEVERERGEQVDTGKTTTRVQVRSNAGQTVKITSSEMSQDDNRAAVSVSTTTTIDPSNNIKGAASVTVPAVGSAVLVAGNAARVRLLVKVPSSEPDGVWLSGAGSASGSGDFIEPGERLIWGTTAELWAYGNGASAVVVTVCEEEII